MKTVKRGRLVICMGTVLMVLCLVTGRAQPQDPTQKPTYGAKDLVAGFIPDPLKQDVVAGGLIQTKNGGLNAWVARNPDFLVNYTAGGASTLTFWAESKEDTTLLIMGPDGVWRADDDSAGMLNPLLKYERPASGKYYIWVGTIGKATAPATLYVTELAK